MLAAQGARSPNWQLFFLPVRWSPRAFLPSLVVLQLLVLLLHCPNGLADERPPVGCYAKQVSACDAALNSCLPKTPSKMPAGESYAPVQVPGGMEVPRADTYLNRTRRQMCDCAGAHRGCLLKISEKCFSKSAFCALKMWRCRTYCTQFPADQAACACGSESSLQMDRRKKEQEEREERERIMFSLGNFFGVLVVLSAAYFGLGSAYNRFRKGRRGLKSCPHGEFWSSCPQRCLACCGWECVRYEPLGAKPNNAFDGDDDDDDDDDDLEAGGRGRRRGNRKGGKKYRGGGRRGRGGRQKEMELATIEERGGGEIDFDDDDDHDDEEDEEDESFVEVANPHRDYTHDDDNDDDEIAAARAAGRTRAAATRSKNGKRRGLAVETSAASLEMVSVSLPYDDDDDEEDLDDVEQQQQQQQQQQHDGQRHGRRRQRGRRREGKSSSNGHGSHVSSPTEMFQGRVAIDEDEHFFDEESGGGGGGGGGVGGGGLAPRQPQPVEEDPGRSGDSGRSHARVVAEDDDDDDIDSAWLAGEFDDGGGGGGGGNGTGLVDDDEDGDDYFYGQGRRSQRRTHGTIL